MQQKFLESVFRSMTSGVVINSDVEILQSIAEVRDSSSVRIEFVRFSDLHGWTFMTGKSSLVHHTGRFFSIIGLNVSFLGGSAQSWSQPIINQPEFGFLGLISKCFDGVLHFLLQCKIEPGNFGRVQLSPTLQATRSNYTQVHKGRVPEYLDYFLTPRLGSVVVDQLQSEQGARFLHKRNRNMVVFLDDDVSVEIKRGFVWVSLPQIKRLMRIDNCINMDTRSVIAALPLVSMNSTLGSSVPELCASDGWAASLRKSSSCVDGALHSYDRAISFLAEQRFHFRSIVEACDLPAMPEWVISDGEIFHCNRRHFRIVPASIDISGREVNSWSQPLVVPVEPGICALLGLNINGVLHFAVQAKRECGLLDSVEFAPSVQCLPSNYVFDGKSSLPFLELILESRVRIIYDTYQSEEGGRFYHEQNRNIIALLDDNFELELPQGFIWLTLGQLQTMLKHSGCINVQLRSLLAAVSFCDDDYGV
jgi:oxidase EvaA